MEATLAGVTASTADGQILTASAMTALNSFDAPDTVRPAPFAGARIAGGALSVTLPPKSVVMLTLR